MVGILLCKSLGLYLILTYLLNMGLDMNRKVRLDRLNKLLYLMENHKEVFPEIKFAIYTWKSVERCGTAACALGSAACYPPFKKAGLKMSNEYDLPEYTTSDGELHEEVDAGREFFGITDDEACHLFLPSFYSHPEYLGSSNPHKFTPINVTIKPKHVATRIKKLIKHYEAI